jgi:D-alanyl-D-alanine carboxypeptidase/D-alanyl-D-alanine-endopeptidase (penicillin-binding protein 4)
VNTVLDTVSLVLDPEKLQLTLEGKGARLAAHVGGSVPEGGRVMRVVKRVDDPSLLAGFVLKSALKDVGIDAAGEPKLGGERAKALLVAHRSAPLGELCASLGKDSDNFYAEMIFEAIAAERKPHPASAEAAA